MNTSKVRNTVKKLSLEDEKFKLLYDRKENKRSDIEMNEYEQKMRLYKRIYMREYYRKLNGFNGVNKHTKYFTEEERKAGYQARKTRYANKMKQGLVEPLFDITPDVSIILGV